VRFDCKLLTNGHLTRPTSTSPLTSHLSPPTSHLPRSSSFNPPSVPPSDSRLADFLIELSIAMQKHAIYPVGHPLLNEAVDGVMRKLGVLLVDRPSLSLDIARRQLIVEGVATDPDHPLLKELSERLHKHNLGAVKFNQGLSRAELGDALATVAVDAGRTNEPLGDKAEELSRRWTNVRLLPLHYERLELLHERNDVEDERILKRGFELGVSGPQFDDALDALLNRAQLELVLDLLDDAPHPEFAESVWSYLDSHDILWTALSEARLDFGVLQRIVRRKRLSAVDPVLDTVEQTKDSRTRERLLDLLTELGDDIAPHIARRIDGARSDLRRELFLVMGKLQSMPPDFDASRFLLHGDAAVRREAVRLLLKFVETREQAIVAGLADTDERATFYALSAAQEGGCPARGVNMLRQRIEKGDLDSSLTTLAIRVLAAADSGASPTLSGRGRTSQMLRAMDLQSAGVNVGKKTFDWLVRKVASKSIFGKWKLRQKSPEMLAALGALSAYWNHDPDVQELVSMAVKSNDAEVRKALSAGRVTGKFKAVTE
jgi:hypothetical protein